MKPNDIAGLAELCRPTEPRRPTEADYFREAARLYDEVTRLKLVLESLEQTLDPPITMEPPTLEVVNHEAELMKRNAEALRIIRKELE